MLPADVREAIKDGVDRRVAARRHLCSVRERYELVSFLNYDYCKGCGVCAQKYSCGAIGMVRE
jgi:Pyruvate/2-oxoacid:ferredoxin oxidoreductase delta subunit